MPKDTDRDRDDEKGFGPDSGRGRFGGRYTREQDGDTGGRQYPRGGGSSDYEGDYGSGPQRGSFGGEFSPNRHDDDYSQKEGGRRGGYSGSFERERDDYQRGMGTEDRGRMGGRSGRDEEFVDLGRRSRFGQQDDDAGRRSREDDDDRHARGGRDSPGGPGSGRDRD
jgi:hypothetical protein